LVVKKKLQKYCRRYAIIGVEGFEIGDTIADFENPEGFKNN
jgi:hypothetical protein